jgi:hypothetical protein
MLSLANDHLTWCADHASTTLENKLTGHTYTLGAAPALLFSAASERIAEPLQRVADFAVCASRCHQAHHAVITLHSASVNLTVALHVHLDGPTRRLWLEFTNSTGRDLLLLDVELDRFAVMGNAIDGGLGQPIFLNDEAFAAIEHPSGDNRLADGQILLAHHPGRRLAPGAKFRSHPALFSVSPAGGARAHFLDYIQSRSRPRPGMIGIYTPFGINNQWGACPTLDDEQTLEVLNHLAQLRKRGVNFDYFTLDTGWVDPASDLTQFKPAAYPRGPEAVIRRIRSLHLKFGLWFATSWGLQSCWDYPGAFADGLPPTQLYREGYPLGADGLTFCLGEKNYRAILQKAVLHHVRKNGVRFLKFDGGFYQCDNPDHGHLPGKYATESMHEWLIGLANRARAIAPDVFIMWYWGLRSPFWALHGDAIFESGLQMEGSGTSSFPTLHYRDSVTLAQDQNAYHARNIPPRLKDSLGVWLSDTRWGNFMGGERWRESLVMDLGRGSRLFPNLWGNLRHLSDEDVEFLAGITQLARKHAALFTHRRLVGGDPFRNEVYGYAHGRGAHGFVFLHNAHFVARPFTLTLDASLGLDAKPGTTVQVVTHFPELRQLRGTGGRRPQLGETLAIQLRPFETLMLEVTPALRSGARRPVRKLTVAQAAKLGLALPLRTVAPDPRLDVRFVETALFARKNLIRRIQTYATTLPALSGDQPILTIVIRLREGAAEWKYAPTVVQIVQVLARVGDRKVQLIPMPDGRQHGNTQSYGCSWLTYRVRLNPGWAHLPLLFVVHANLPAGVEAVVEAWVVRRWWHENPRPTADGYYTYAPS